MNFKRAILCGALGWILIFFEVCILMFGFKLAGLNYYLAHYIILLGLSLIPALVYFKKGIKTGAKQGLLAGILFLITGLILDSIITIPLFVKSFSFFSNIYLWIGILESIIIVTIVGAVKK